MIAADSLIASSSRRKGRRKKASMNKKQEDDDGSRSVGRFQLTFAFLKRLSKFGDQEQN